MRTSEIVKTTATLANNARLLLRIIPEDLLKMRFFDFKLKSVCVVCPLYEFHE
ncbi:MAG: hypothetical protein LBP35_01190 [Candidatus Ancillula trichonymphae]|nr:hypothetical protein [Candidatus Ancillula trichonymphae]